ncbi:MAG: MBL fold metallo-hydrolase [Verrucomicrobia bacterium]|nr:MBL fold metallo-hydrolase [Verrucomicrobiota bacterium]
MVIEYAPLEDELGDVLDKAMRHASLTEQALAERSSVSLDKIRDAIDYRYDLTPEELTRLADTLEIKAAGLTALAQGRYPLPEIAGLPFCLYPLRFQHGIGVANAYIVADCCQSTGILFDTGTEYTQLRRVWPKNIKKPEAIFITHCETEHTGGLNDFLRSEGQMPVFCPEGKCVPGAVALGEGARLTFGRLEVQALKTPGHCESHNCYVVTVPSAPTAAPLLISGDTLFAGSTGAAFFCRQKLATSLRRVLDQLPENTVVAPGHGPLTTIKNERRFNPFVE